jgi:hypothetical protein
LTAPTSPAPQPGSVYIAEGDTRHTALARRCAAHPFTGLGMPIASSPDRGRLAVVISVVFPDAMPALAEVISSMIVDALAACHVTHCASHVTRSLQLASSLHAACGSSERCARPVTRHSFTCVVTRHSFTCVSAHVAPIMSHVTLHTSHFTRHTFIGLLVSLGKRKRFCQGQFQSARWRFL